MKPLTPAERRDLRAKAHHLDPVVTIGQHGLTPQVLHEIDVALLAHELVKVKVLGDDRELRTAMLDQAVAALDCAPVQHVGKILVFWRSNPEIAKAAKAKAARARAADAAAQSKKAPKKTGPRAPVDNVRERRRATPGTWGAGKEAGQSKEPGQGKGRRGAARHGPVASELPPAEPSATTRRRTRRADNS